MLTGRLGEVGNCTMYAAYFKTGSWSITYFLRLTRILGWDGIRWGQVKSSFRSAPSSRPHPSLQLDGNSIHYNSSLGVAKGI